MHVDYNIYIAAYTRSRRIVRDRLLKTSTVSHNKITNIFTTFNRSKIN